MRKAQGWTLIELVMTVLLLSLLSAFVFYPSVDPKLWQEQRFIQDWFEAYGQAQQLTAYGNVPVDITLDGPTFKFMAMTILGEKKAWQLEKPDFVSVDAQSFPLKMVVNPPTLSNEQSSKSLVHLRMPHHVIIIDKVTLYAFVRPNQS